MLRPPDHQWNERWPPRPEPNELPPLDRPGLMLAAIGAVVLFLLMMCPFVVGVVLFLGMR